MSNDNITILDNTQHALSTERGDVQSALATWLLNIDSDNTRRAYQKAWGAFLAHTGISHPYDVTYEDMSAYREHLSTTTSQRTGKPLSQCTINQKISAISSFFTHAIDKGYVSDEFKNPCDGIKRQAVTPYGKATKLKHDHEDGSQVVKFLMQIDRETFQGKRDNAIMRLMITTGVRVSVIANAYISDIEQVGTDYFLRYKNKGGASETAKISGVINDLAHYLSARGIMDINSTEPLFVATPRGKKVMVNTGNDTKVEKPITARTVNNLIYKYAKMAGLSGIHAHSLRHTAAHMSRNKPISEIKGLLKHKDPRITLIYLDSLDDDAGDNLTDDIANELERGVNRAM